MPTIRRIIPCLWFDSQAEEDAKEFHFVNKSAWSFAAVPTLLLR